MVGDRLSGWTEIVQVRKNSASSGAKGLCEALRKIFATFGVPEEISSDGGPEFVATEATDFYSRWGLKHRLSSAYFPQSNGRAEVAVKITKRLLEDNMTEDGTLNTDKMVRALLQQRNTPDRDCKLRPAEVLFGRGLRDAMPQLAKSATIFKSDKIHNQWHQAWSAKEEAIRARLVRSCEQLETGSRELPSLREGDQVFIQNQDKSHGRPNKWDRQGTIIALKDNDQHLVKVHGSGRLTLRNRRFLRKFQLRLQFLEERPSLIPMAGNYGNPSLHQHEDGELITNPDKGERQLCEPVLQHPDVVDAQCPESIDRVDDREAGYHVSDSAPNTPGATIPVQQLPQQSEQPRTRPPGRPPKRRQFNFARRIPDQLQPADVEVPQCPEGSDRANWREPESRRPIRKCQQRQIYDAATGGYKDPCG